MKAFAALLDRLSYVAARNGKLRLIEDYLRATPDPDRGWAIAALTDGLPFSFPVRRILTEMVTQHIDEELYRLSRDYVGDTAETVALLWPDRGRRDATSDALPDPPTPGTPPHANPSPHASPSAHPYPRGGGEFEGAELSEEERPPATDGDAVHASLTQADPRNDRPDVAPQLQLFLHLPSTARSAERPDQGRDDGSGEGPDSREVPETTTSTGAFGRSDPGNERRADNGEDDLRLSHVVEALQHATPASMPPLVAGWLDRLDVTGRWALLKLLTGALRVGVSARLAKTALAALGPVDVAEIEEMWHAAEPPYADVFAWLEGRAPKPSTADRAVFRPMMLAHPIDDAEMAALDLGQYQIEWKWDGIRVQIAAAGGDLRLFSRTGDDISTAIPDIASALAGSLMSNSVLDGELLVVRAGEVAPFNDLQQRLNRKIVTRKQMDVHPAHVRLYDALVLDGEELRELPLIERRARLEAWHERVRPERSSLSEVLSFASRDALDRAWRETRANGIEGLMLKRRDSAYVGGRPKGLWYKLKRAALTADCVLMYAQRGSGKRSSFYSDYTFGTWTDDKSTGERMLVPVGKAYSGFTDEELLTLDKWIRGHTRERFGPVLSVEPQLVLEVAFDAVHRSARHKSGVAMRFPRIHRIRWDKPAAEADTLEALTRLIAG